MLVLVPTVKGIPRISSSLAVAPPPPTGAAAGTGASAASAAASGDTDAPAPSALVGRLGPASAEAVDACFAMARAEVSQADAARAAADARAEAAEADAAAFGAAGDAERRRRIAANTRAFNAEAQARSPRGRGHF